MTIKNTGGPAHAQGTRPDGPAVACRCCPGGIGRSTRVPRYPSDTSDAEWQVLEPTLPAPAWKAGKGGRPAERCRRDYVDAIRYLVKEGIQWRAMPADLPHWRTVYESGRRLAQERGDREDAR